MQYVFLSLIAIYDFYIRLHVYGMKLVYVGKIGAHKFYIRP